MRRLLQARKARVASQEQVSLTIDRDILARFRATGPGWQVRLNPALRRAADELPES